MKRFKNIIEQIGLLGKYENNVKDERCFFDQQFIGTKWGITAPSLAKFLGRTPLQAEMKYLSKIEAIQLLFYKYWIGQNLNLLTNDSVATLLFSNLVNIGTNKMRPIVQKALVSLGQSIPFYNVFTTQGIGRINLVDQKRLFNQLYTTSKLSYKQTKSHLKKYHLIGQLQRINFISSGATVQNLISKQAQQKLYNAFNPKTPNK